MSTTHRVDFWTNEIKTPFTKQTFYKNPGPGAYNFDKKKDDIKSKLLMEEAVRVPFGSSDERGFNKKQPIFGPGPGTYIDIHNPNNSSICKSLNKIREDRTLAESQGIKIGAFGSTSGRWDKGAWNFPKDGPGPGSYDSSSIMTAPTMDLTVKGEAASMKPETALASEQRKANSVFVSTTNRFNTVYSAQNPHIRMLSRGGPKKRIIAQSDAGKHIYDEQAVFGVENQITCINNETFWKTQQTRAADCEQVLGRKVGFDSTSARFSYN